MEKNRMEAFSDGVLAIIITIMVLELKAPASDQMEGLQRLLPVFSSYLLSFVYVGIYWNNHHHLLHTVKHINGRILWLNLHLLFWLSLVPFATAWLGEHYLSTAPTALYGATLFMASVAYYMLTAALIHHHGRESELGKAFGRDIKGKLSMVAYALGIGLSFLHPWLGFVLYILVAIGWFIPDRRVEKHVRA